MRSDSAIFRALWACLGCLLLVAAPPPAPAQESNVYTVANLSIDRKARDAVTAKNEALALAKRQALHTVFRRVTPFNSSVSYPDVQPAAIDDMLEGFAVQRERNSATRYLATLDFTFSAGEVRKALAGKGLPVTDQQSAPVAVLPIYIDKGTIDHTGRDPWRMAWNGLDLAHAIVPVKLARAAPSFDVAALTALLGGDERPFVELRDKVRAERLMLAIAEPAADGATLTTRLFGVDRVGSVGLTRHDPVRNGDVKAAAAYAASIALGVIEGRWKLVRAPGAAGPGGGALAGLDVVVEFSGMSQWKDIRARLVKVPGVHALDVKSLSARTAQVALQFPGGAEHFSRALASHGLSLHGREGSWILRSN